VEVGQHLYWQIGGFQVHAQVLITSWIVIAILLSLAFFATRNLQTIFCQKSPYYPLNKKD
jgi:F-type H+-transporting ATPase subunit a